MSPHQAGNTGGYRPSDEGSSRSTSAERGGIDVRDSVMVRQPIRDGQTEVVRDVLTRWARDNRDGDAHTLLPVDGVTLFLDDGGFGWAEGGDHDPDRGDALLWYVEVSDDDAGTWVTPDRTIRNVSPFFDRGLSEPV